MATRLNLGYSDAHARAALRPEPDHPRPLVPHWLFAALFVAGVVLRVVTVSAYQPAFFLNDSLYYLANTAELSSAGYWPVGYSVVLRGILAVGDLATVVWVQHAVGLLIAAGIYVLLLRAGARPWIAAVAAAPLLLDGYQLVIQHYVLGETWFELLTFVAFAFLTDRVGRLGTARTRLVTAGLAGLALGLAVSIRLVGVLLIVPLIGYLLIEHRLLRQRAAAAVLCVAMVALPVLAMLLAFRAETGELGLTSIGGRMLYARIAPWVDCSRVDPPASQRSLCPAEPLGSRMKIEAYMWDRSTPAWIFDPADAPPGATTDDVLRDFAKRAILAQPGDFVRAVASDMVKAFAPTRRQYEGDVRVARWRFQLEYPRSFRDSTFDATFDGAPPVLRLDPGQARLLRGYQLSIGSTSGMLLAIALVLGAVGAAFRTPLRWVALPWVAGALIVMLAPSVYQFSWRYMLPGLVLAPVAGAYGATALWPRAPHGG
ncbi:MAG TPA: phospholipid carrier-dependent glycosyltransferase [Euzebyales bacterium]|nr:phospholipid carrier-dependent glycosyltransferase [Euzebyales bacterium]